MLYPQARAGRRRRRRRGAGAPRRASTSPPHARSARERGRLGAAGPVAEVRDVDADGVPCRLYRARAAAPGVVVHLHGGGFVFHDIDVHDNPARRLANRCGAGGAQRGLPAPTGAPVPGRARRRRHRRRLARRRTPSRGVAGPTYVHGDSAGGNLALVAALRNPGRFRALALTYPFLDPEAAGASYHLTRTGLRPGRGGLVLAAVRRHASRPDRTPTSRRCSPTGSARCRPTLVVTAEYDPLRDEGELLAARLAEEGVAVVATRYLGQLHGFWRHAEVFDAADALTGQIAGFFRSQRPRRAARVVRMTAPMYLPQFFVRQKLTMMVNRYEVTEANPDGSVGRLLAVAQQKRMALKEQVTFFRDEAPHPAAVLLPGASGDGPRRGLRRPRCRPGHRSAASARTSARACSARPSTSAARGSRRPARSATRSVAILRRFVDFPFAFHFDFADQATRGRSC